MDELNLVGKVERQHVNNVKVDKFWERCEKDGTLKVLLNHSTSINKEYFGIADGSSYDGDSYLYYIATPFCGKTIPRGFITKRLPSSLWIKFDCSDVGNEDVISQELWTKIYSDFFPTSIYEPAEYQLEVYSNGETEKGPEIWIAVKQKESI